MLQHVNKVILIGNVGNDPDQRKMPNGNDVVTFSVATNEFWIDKNSQRQTKTEWHSIVVYNQNLINFIMKFVHKGIPVYIEGTLKTRNYTDKNGIERNKAEIVLQSFEHTIKIVDSRPYNGNSNEIQEYSNKNDQNETKNYNDDYNNQQVQDDQNDINNIDDDEIPF